MAHVLIIDDNQAGSSRLHSLMQKKGHQCSVAFDVQEAMRFSREQNVDVVLINSIVLQGKNGIHVHQLHTTPSAPDVIIMSENGCPEEAEKAINNGAWDYVVTNGSLQSITAPLSKVIKYRQKQKRDSTAQKQQEIKTAGIIGKSAALKSCLATLMQAAQSDTNVLITGETGTGKELFATALHENSRRRNGNFVVVDCAALPETLVESTLFGHEKGAFTGATHKQYGLVNQADKGTLFLDEIGELPMSVQKSFLRVLEERRFRPVGGKGEIKSDFRLVAATNQNLDAMVDKGLFREDLLFRLRTFSLELPPLHSRLTDTAHLVKYFIQQRAKNNPIFDKAISKDFLMSLRKYQWPGNVRELFHALEHSCAAAQEHTILFPYHLPTYIRVEIAKASLPRTPDSKKSPSEKEEKPEKTCVYHTINARRSLQQVREEVLAKTEETYLKELLANTGRNISQAIEISGLSRSRLYQLLKDYQIRPASGK
ncbi:MAG: sigma-54 dependent transcriptional regulator [Desulfobulbaceae bacterium]|nr:sigma-54 dependent transcriptional regulator [Desulfobulbaceae bacterium]